MFVPAGEAVGELAAVIGQCGMQGIRHRSDQITQRLGRHHLAGPLLPCHIGELAGPVEGNKEIAPALGRLRFCDIDVAVADWVGLEYLGMTAITFWNRYSK